jgi:large conductance mechanosensitive channel
VFKGFRDFILRGNVVDLAVAVILGAAFNAIVTSFANDVLMQFVSAIIGKPDFKDVIFYFGPHHTPIRVGILLNALVGFLISASAIYFGVVMPVHFLLERIKKREAVAPPPPNTKVCPECLSEIPLAARRCAHCTQPQPPLEPVPTASQPTP